MPPIGASASTVATPASARAATGAPRPRTSRATPTPTRAATERHEVREVPWGEPRRVGRPREQEKDRRQYSGTRTKGQDGPRTPADEGDEAKRGQESAPRPASSRSRPPSPGTRARAAIQASPGGATLPSPSSPTEKRSASRRSATRKGTRPSPTDATGRPARSGRPRQSQSTDGGFDDDEEDSVGMDGHHEPGGERATATEARVVRFSSARTKRSTARAARRRTAEYIRPNDP